MTDEPETTNFAVRFIALPRERQQRQKSKVLNVLDTFAGAGGFSLGFELAGCKVVGGFEIGSWASETFAHNHKHALVIQ